MGIVSEGLRPYLADADIDNSDENIDLPSCGYPVSIICIPCVPGIPDGP